MEVWVNLIDADINDINKFLDSDSSIFFDIFRVCGRAT